jgi:hypothetical protein
MGSNNKKLTEEEINMKIELCKSVHNNKYSYDKVKYVNYDTKVIITCPVHGDFEQNLYHHSKGNGCKKCRGLNVGILLRKNKEDFVMKSNITHDNKYSYDKVPDSFIVKNKVTIICPIHGDFKQTADSHKRGHGCPYCVGKRGIDKDKNISVRTNKINDFIKKYEFEHVRLIELSTKYDRLNKFICDIHGEFSKNTSQVSKGQICGKCIKIKNRKDRRENELQKMINRHNNKFEYLDYVDLINGKDKITIRCKEHDHTFKYFKSTHLFAKFGGCKHCLKQYRNIGRKEIDDVINDFRNIHGEKYGYDNVNYQGSNVKISITCTKHGDFQQIPGSHLKGSGCPKCKHSTGEKLIQNILKKMEIKYTSQKFFYGCMNDKTGKSLPFDIYVPEFHTCIEFDGYQHFIPVERWGGDDKLKEVQYRDNIKNVYCKDNDINLIRIPYTMGKIEIVDILNQKFNKDLIVDIKQRTKWIDINIKERVKKYKTRKEFCKKDVTLWHYCYKHKIMDMVCEHMPPKPIRYTYKTAKEICEKYTDYTLFERERGGLINYIKNNKVFELVEHMDKRRVIWTDEEIMEEIKKYRYKQDARKSNIGLYKVLLKRDMVDLLEDKTIHWTEQMVRDVFIKCNNRTELNKNYRGAENYAVKHGLYDELSSHFIRKKNKNI